MFALPEGGKGRFYLVRLTAQPSSALPLNHTARATAIVNNFGYTKLSNARRYAVYLLSGPVRDTSG
ncbi:MAG: hypothetical protein K0Q63_2667 [Paenibacillus sp.]|jgi:hypothetical protein|nr:hypothetical protein [Paenibacillus sp.]